MTPYPRGGHEVWVVPHPKVPKRYAERRFAPKRIGIFITREIADAIVYFEDRALSPEARRVITFEIRPGTIGRCRTCGCTERRACPEGCYWVQPDLCSTCATDELADAARGDK